MRNTWNPTIVLASPPDWTLGGDYLRHTPRTGSSTPQPGPQIYWFAGEYRNPSQAAWQRDAAVGHSYDIYDNGTLSTVGWDDTGGDRDMDDLIVEVAVVYRRSYFDMFLPVELVEADVEAFARDVLPRYQERDRAAPRRRSESAMGGRRRRRRRPLLVASGLQSEAVCRGPHRGATLELRTWWKMACAPFVALSASSASSGA
jgi:hypothetical protein